MTVDVVDNSRSHFRRRLR